MDRENFCLQDVHLAVIEALVSDRFKNPPSSIVSFFFAYSSAATPPTIANIAPPIFSSPAPLLELGAWVVAAAELELLVLEDVELELLVELAVPVLELELESDEVVLEESVPVVLAEPVLEALDEPVDVGPPVGREAVPVAPATVKAGA